MTVPAIPVSNNSIVDQIKNYFTTLPPNWKAQALEGGIFHAFSAIIFTGNPVLAIGCGILSATATTIHAISTPLFKNIKTGSQWGNEMLRGGVALTLTYCISMALGGKLAVKKLAISLFAYGILLVANPSENTGHAHRFLICP